MTNRRTVASILLIVAAITKEASLTTATAEELGEAIRELNRQNNTVPVCDESDKTGNWFIYCSGKLLEAVNVHRLELDWKIFVDRPMKKDPETVRKEFEKKFGKQEVEDINPQELLAFRRLYFGEPGAELEHCTPTNWQHYPPKIMMIENKELREFALNLNERWKLLCRHMKQLEHPDRHSLIYVKHPFIVPGGRFIEFYYWDAYWIIKGLIISGLLENAWMMIDNFAQCVQRFGFVPNGGRVYYLRRSQPPFLIPMAYEYYEATKNRSFIKEKYEILKQEFNFWREKRSIVVNNRTVYVYRTKSNVPRPESYGIDVANSLSIEPSKRQQFFQDVASAAESGWDFSSRWFEDRINLQTIETTKVVPVDLNAILCWNANILKYFALELSKKNDVEMFENIRQEMWETLEKVFYDSNEKAWFDYNLRTNDNVRQFYPSVAMPLLSGCYPELNHEISAKIVDYFNRTGAFAYQSGIPTSMNEEAGEQWDYPNGWAPLQHMVIEGMRKSDNPAVQEIVAFPHIF